jgi:DNA-binding LacI/PurR family transcriptional regulator
MVFTIAAAARIVHRTPGKDLDIVGYDNYWRDLPDQLHEPYVPPVTIDKDNHQIGFAAAHLLLDRLNGKLSHEPEFRTVPVVLKTS